MIDSENIAPIGFLSALEVAETGICGGLLLLNDRGRPLEFHCNSPIRPSRAHEILYGPTLRSFLLCESISRALIEKCSRQPIALLTDLVELSEMASWAEMPIAWISKDACSTADSGNFMGPVARWTSFEIHGQQVGIAVSERDRRAELEAAISVFASRMPLAEPFQRIQLAIKEAQTSARWRESA